MISRLPRLGGRGLAAALAGALLLGVLGWGGVNWAIEATNSLEFCISCHEMRDTVYKEYSHTIHARNRTGVRATCADCHVPRSWGHKMIRKIQATSELFHKIAGTVDTPEKFDAHRLEMAKRVWATMRATDSRECRNCHSHEDMSQKAQKATAWREHQAGRKDGRTCIDCHKGIAHKDISDLYEDDASPAQAK